MKPLSQAQIGWLCALRAMPAGLSRLSIQVGQGQSIPSLVRRGLAEWRSSSFLVITDVGRAAVEDWELCKACQEVTHIGEAACTHCGHFKSWFV
jgi:hypothetical protein